MSRSAVAVLIVCAACSKASAPEPAATRWLALTPMPVTIQVPVHATAAQTQESLDRDAPPGMIVSARECVLVVTPGSRGPLATQEAAITAAHPGATIARRESPAADGADLFLGFAYAGTGGSRLASFRLEKTIGETTYRCEPFTGRPDVACEERACRSLRAP